MRRDTTSVEHILPVLMNQSVKKTYVRQPFDRKSAYRRQLVHDASAAVRRHSANGLGYVLERTLFKLGLLALVQTNLMSVGTSQGNSVKWLQKDVSFGIYGLLAVFVNQAHQLV